MEKDSAIAKKNISPAVKIKNLLLGSRTKIIIFLAIILVLGYFAWQRFGGSKTQTQYQTASVERGTLVVSVVESGQVSVANRISVNTQASGAVDQVFVKNGDTVTVGEKIASISLDQSGQQRQAQAWASYLSSKNTVDSTNANLYTLQNTMFVANQKFMNDAVANNKATSDPVYVEENAAWLAAEAAYKNQSAVIAQAQAALNSAWLSYQEDSSVITAPSAGKVEDLTIVAGMQIGNSASSSNGTTVNPQAIASVTTEGNPVISISLSEIDAAKVKTGQKATLTFDALAGKTFTGKISGINTTGSVTSGVTTYPATIILDTPNNAILPNMSANANIITAVKSDVLLVPTSAVQTSNGQATVRILQNGNVSSVSVEAGESSDTQTEIISGLSEGDNVVTGVVSSQQGSASPFGGGLRIGGFGGGFGGGGNRGRGG